MKTLSYVLAFSALWCATIAKAQPESGSTVMNSLSIFFIDSHSSTSYARINSEMLEKLKEKVKYVQDDDKNFFLGYLVNGENGRTSSKGDDFIKKQVSLIGNLNLKGPNSQKEKELFRDVFLNQYDLRIKNSVELNVFLSEYSIYRIMNDVKYLPSAITLASELPLYVNNPDVELKINYYITRLSESRVDGKNFNELAIENLLTFYLDEISRGRVRPKIEFL